MFNSCTINIFIILQFLDYKPIKFSMQFTNAPIAPVVAYSAPIFLNGFHFTKRSISKRLPSKNVLRTGKFPNGSGFLHHNSQVHFHFIQA